MVVTQIWRSRQIAKRTVSAGRSKPRIACWSREGRRNPGDAQYGRPRSASTCKMRRGLFRSKYALCRGHYADFIRSYLLDLIRYVPFSWCGHHLKQGLLCSPKELGECTRFMSDAAVTYEQWSAAKSMDSWHHGPPPLTPLHRVGAILVIQVDSTVELPSKPDSGSAGSSSRVSIASRHCGASTGLVAILESSNISRLTTYGRALLRSPCSPEETSRERVCILF